MMQPEIFEFEGNRRGSLPPCGPIRSAQPDDHMIANVELFRSWPTHKLLPGTLFWLKQLREDTERSFATRKAAGFAQGEQPPKWTWNLE